MSGVGVGGATAPIWAELSRAGEAARERPIAEMFAEDPLRFERFSARQDDLLLDFSKEKLTSDGFAALLRLAEAAELPARRAALFAGEAVNATEGRAARHDILRAPEPPMAGVAERRDAFLAFAEAVRSGARRGATGEAFTDIVNIGIGGSYLGPRLVVEALRPLASDGPRVHFVANVDPWSFHALAGRLDPARTLFICASKSFTTQETMLNFDAARAWASAALGEAAQAHFCAVTAKPDAAMARGLSAEAIFEIWDWAGGRYSVWSAIGLCAAIGLGRARFEAFLAGGAEMDAHFREAPMGENLPVIAALIGIWRRNALGHPAYVLAPYEERLAALPEYVQQLEMESNGKSVDRSGAALARGASPAVFGVSGTNAQHSFFQKLHQGTDAQSVDFIVGAETPTPGAEAQRVLLAHCLAQSQAMMSGLDLAEARAQLESRGASADEAERLAPHLVCPGDRPSTTMIYRRLDPRTLGRLIALFEHKTFAQSVIWDIECFDQWGVELGKRLANRLIAKLDDRAAWSSEDASTRGLLAWRRRLIDEA